MDTSLSTTTTSSSSFVPDTSLEVPSGATPQVQDALVEQFMRLKHPGGPAELLRFLSDTEGSSAPTKKHKDDAEVDDVLAAMKQCAKFSGRDELRDLFEHLPEFILPAEFFNGSDLDVIARYCKEVRKRINKPFGVRGYVIRDIGKELILSLPAHCGFKECRASMRTSENTFSEWKTAAVFLKKELLAMHEMAAVVYDQAW